MRIYSSMPWLLMAEAFLWLCLKNGPPFPWDAAALVQGRQRLPRQVPGWWHRVPWQTVAGGCDNVLRMEARASLHALVMIPNTSLYTDVSKQGAGGVNI